MTNDLNKAGPTAPLDEKDVSQPIDEGMEVFGYLNWSELNQRRYYDEVPRGQRDPWPLVRLSDAQALIAAKDATIEELTREIEMACNDLRGFLTSFVREHFPDNTAWKPFPDLLGMLTQMDNASTIARDYKARIKALEEALRPFAFEGLRTDIERFDDETHIEVHFPRTNPRKATPVSWVYVEDVLRARATLNSREKE